MIRLLVLFVAACSHPAAGPPRYLAHRGVHQSYACGHLGRDGCSATCIEPPTHDYLENTIRSMRAAFELGADVVELDVHPTTDGQLAVFHDWTVDCRTNGTGRTRDHSWTYLKTLDIGYGYTADHGKTFPFRGRGVGLMPTLAEVLDTFPDRRFLIHIKSNVAGDGDVLARELLRRPVAQRKRLMVYGGERPVERVLAVVPELRGMTGEREKRCVARYVAVGWTGHVPDVCRHALLLLPARRAHWLWGWPSRFLARMAAVDTDVYVVAVSDDGWILGLEHDASGAGIWTDHIERVATTRRGR